MSRTFEIPDDEERLLEIYRGRFESPEELFGLAYHELRRVARATCVGSAPTKPYRPPRWGTKLISGGGFLRGA